MELRHLRYFVAVAESLNFRRAAERLHIAQPPLSQQIKRLEAELGVSLLERTTRSVRLTRAGTAFLVDARVALSAASQARRRALEAEQGVVGTLRLGFIAATANARLANILRSFRARFAGIQLSLHDLTSIEQLNSLRSGELDAGLLRAPIGFSDLEFRFVEECHLSLATPPTHRLARKRRLDWSDFHDEAMVMMHPTMQHSFYDNFLTACAKAGARPRPVQYANDIQTKLWLISAGFGLAPTIATMSDWNRPGVLFRPLPSPLPAVHTLLVWRRDDGSPVLRNFREFFAGMVPDPNLGESSSNRTMPVPTTTLS